MSVDYSVSKVNHAVMEFEKQLRLENKLEKTKQTIATLVKAMSDKEFNEYVRKTTFIEHS